MPQIRSIRELEDQDIKELKLFKEHITYRYNYYDVLSKEEKIIFVLTIIKNIGLFNKIKQKINELEASVVYYRNNLLLFVDGLISNLMLEKILHVAESCFINDFNYDIVTVCIGSADDDYRWQTIPVYTRNYSTNNKKVLIVNIDPCISHLTIFEKFPPGYLPEYNNLRIINIPMRAENIDVLLKKLLNKALQAQKEVILHNFSAICRSVFNFDSISSWFNQLSLEDKKKITIISGYFNSFPYNLVFVGSLKQPAEKIRTQYEELICSDNEDLKHVNNIFLDLDNQKMVKEILKKLTPFFENKGWKILPENNKLSLEALIKTRGSYNDKYCAECIFNLEMFILESRIPRILQLHPELEASLEERKKQIMNKPIMLPFVKF